MTTQSTWGKQWDHKLPIKDLLDPDAEDHNAHAAKIASVAAARVRTLAARIRDESLRHELEDIAQEFDDVPECDDPCDAFNSVLSELYDLGDAGKRIWIA